VGLFAIYKIVPAAKVPVYSAFLGALLGTGILLVIHNGFLWLSHEVFNYGNLYGGIAAIPLLLVWILVIWYGLLVGAVFATSNVSAKALAKNKGLT
jgi:membrane protein